MKATRLSLPALEFGPGVPLAVGLIAAAAVVWTATDPRYFHRIYPEPPSLFVPCVYLALAGLAVLSTRASHAMRVLVWAPVLAHLVMIAFACYSFLVRGHWPWYGQPDPSELNLPLTYLAAVISVFSVVLTFPAACIALIASARHFRRDNWRAQSATALHSLAVLALGAWLWLFESQDRRLFGWLAD